MKEFRRYRSVIFLITSDIAVIIGVVFFGWNLTRVLGIYCLNVMVMVTFIALYLKRSNRIPFGPQMIAAIAVMWWLIYLFYFIVADTAGEIKDLTFSNAYLPVFEPADFFPAIILSALFGQYFEYRSFVTLMQREKEQQYSYNYIFLLRLSAIVLVILFSGVLQALFHSNNKTTVLLPLVLMKDLIEWRIFYLTRKNPQEEDLPLI